EPFRERVDAFGADTMQAARILVGALSELAPCVQICQNQLNGGDFPLGMHVDRNASAVVANRYGSIHVNGYFDVIAKPRQMLVDWVIQHLKNIVMQAALGGVPDVHA